MSAVRLAVFVEEQGIDREAEFDHRDPGCLHALARLAGKAVGAARLTEDAGRGKIGRVAVLPEARGRGIGRGLVLCLMEAGREKGFEEFVLSAQLSAVAFYESMGYRQVGESYMEDGIEHITMVSG